MSGAEDRRREASVKTVVENLAQVTDRTQSIVREEIELAKAEVTQKIASLGRGVAVGAAAGIFVALGGLFLLHALAFFLWWVVGSPGGQIFWGYLITAVLLFVLAGLGGFLAYKFVKKGAPPTPDMAIAEAKLVRETMTNAGTTPKIEPHGPERTLGTADARNLDPRNPDER